MSALPLTRYAQSLALRCRAAYSRWLAHRIPEGREVVLNHRRIFIFPTRAGALYLLLVALLLVTAINYQNSGVYLLVFMLVGQFFATIMATYSNLSGLHVRRGNASSGYAGDRVTFHLLLKREPARAYHSLRLGWPDQWMVDANLDTQCEAVVEMYHAAPSRGLLRSGRILVETVYPLGLLRAWTWLDLQLECWVYPRPLPCSNLPVAEVATGYHEPSSAVRQQDEFANIRPWRRHDPPRQVLWKAYAREQPLMTMEFSEAAQREVWLDEALVASPFREERLSVLCFAALQLAGQDRCFGLRLSTGEEIAVAQGDEHLRSALLLLATQPLALQDGAS